MTQCYEMHTSERPKLEDIVKPEEGYMKSAKSLASLGGSLLQGVVVSDRMSLFFSHLRFKYFQMSSSV